MPGERARSLEGGEPRERPLPPGVPPRLPEAVRPLVPRLARVLRRFPEVRAAYLFGSQAQGRARPESDVDVALVTDPPLGEERLLELAAALVEEGLDRVDLTELPPEDLILRFEAVSPNLPLYLAPGFDHGEYCSRTLREYFDLAWLLRHQRVAVRRRWERHGPR